MIEASGPDRYQKSPDLSHVPSIDSLVYPTYRYVQFQKHELERLLRDHALSLDDLEHTRRLMDTSSDGLNLLTGKLHTIRRLMEPMKRVDDARLDEYLKDVYAEFDALVLSGETEGWIKDDDVPVDRLAPFEQKIDAKFQDLADQNPDLWVDMLKNIFEDRFFGNRIFDRMREMSSRFSTSELHQLNLVRDGLFLSMILNSVIKSVPEDVRSNITQEFHFTSMNNLLYFGFHHMGGVYTVDHIGDYFGCDMKGGILKADIAENYAGRRMEGGVIELSSGYDDIGSEMKAGEIKVKNARNYIGSFIQGGTITSTGKVEQEAGVGMKGGTLILSQAGEACGHKMKGGKIDVRNATHSLGALMDGGEITVGTTGGQVGYRMMGGKIFITGTSGSLSEFIGKNAEIYLRGVKIH